MSDKIKINKVHGSSNGDMLKGCYFEPAGTLPETYKFYDKDKDNPKNPLATGIQDGSDIAFILMEDPTLPWAIQIGKIDDSGATGDFVTGKRAPGTAQDQPGVGLDQTSGSFQAEAGGAFDPEDAAASAIA